MTKTQAISLMIAEKIVSGMNAKDAIDAVLGAGTVAKLAGEVYDALKSKEAK